MSSYNVAPLDNLIDQFERLPNIGHKSAQRLAYHILTLPENTVKEFADALINAKKSIHFCKSCCNLTDKEYCPICSNPKRDLGTICVVERPRDVVAMERTQEYTGVYHVLHGAISPLMGIGPDSLCIKELIARVSNDEIKEVIMATNPTVEGEATAVYLSKLLKPLGVKVTHLAYGIPVGADLTYADEITLARALEGRTDL
ncbi:MAG: recombination mediator RecR [Clostridia bacterium]|nr:recombination mediator RecR [Clostridia bacterium]